MKNYRRISFAAHLQPSAVYMVPLPESNDDTCSRVVQSICDKVLCRRIFADSSPNDADQYRYPRSGTLCHAEDCHTTCILAPALIVNFPRAGEHTRSIAITTPSVASAGIMRFAKKKAQCLGCRQLLDDASATLCSHCKPQARS